MKKVILLALVVAVGYFGYSHFINVQPASAEDQRLEQIERQINSAHQRLGQAMRAAGSNMDTTANVESVRMSLPRLEEELNEVKPTLRTDSARRKAQELESLLIELRKQLE